MDNEEQQDTPSFVRRLKTIDPELYAIAQNETSGGINLNHAQVESGLNKGHTAGGPWGMMPITAKEIVNRSKEFQEKYPDVIEFEPEMLTHVLNNDPQLAYALAKAEYERRLKSLGGDEEKVAHSWLHGVTGTKKMPEEVIENSSYVQKFRDMLEKVRKSRARKSMGKEVP